MSKNKGVAPQPRMQSAPRSAPPPLMGVRLPAFSSDRTACAKCGHFGAKTIYMNSGQSCTHNGEGLRIVWGTERLHRICERCRFAWDEACVPAIPLIVHPTVLMPAVRSA